MRRDHRGRSRRPRSRSGPDPGALRLPGPVHALPDGRSLPAVRRQEWRGGLMSFDFLFQPVEQMDAWLEGLFAGAPLVVALLIALALGLRHASDPDHLVSVPSPVAVDGGDVRGATRLGAWWGAGHAAALLVIGIPLIILKSTLPAWIEHGAEIAVGIVILLLALRIVVKWIRGDFRAGRHPHRPASGSTSHRHLHHAGQPDHRHRNVRTPRQALGIGLLHGVAGTGAVALLLI